MLRYNKSNIVYTKSLRSNMTPWEQKLWYQYLRTYPVRFQRQKAIDNFIVDFTVPEPNSLSNSTEADILKKMR